MIVYRSILIATTLVCLAACSSDNHPATAAAEASQEAPAVDNYFTENKPLSADNVATSDTSADAAPKHNYSMEDGGEYGYQPEVSQDDQNAGVQVKPLVMVRYLGKRKGKYILSTTNANGTTTLLSCSDPCEYMKAEVVMSGQLLNTMTLPNQPGTIGSMAMEDAINGQLKLYRRH